MAQSLITKFEDFTPSNVTYGAPRTNTRGGKSIKILDEKRNNLVLTSPLLLTWGINKMEDEKTGRVSYNMALQFPGQEYSNDSNMEFLEKIKELEELVLDACVKNSKEWFGKASMSKEVAKELMYPILKYPKNKDTQEIDYSRSPTMKIKIPFWEGNFNLELYDMDKNALFKPNMSNSLEDGEFEQFIPKTAYVSCILQCNGIWFTSGRFGVTWQLTQAVVRRPVRIEGGCFISLSSDDKKTVSDVEKREDMADDGTEQVDTTQVHDSDDEHEPEPELEEKPKKTVVKKRRTVATKSKKST
tara:strand:- start:3250 stop:4152 length:903 start_codon:yes stop_codon:yes gene_type:complete